MGIKIIRLRHRTIPPIAGCRWCGFPEGAHGHRHEPFRHDFTDPTPQQRVARKGARGNWVANFDRTRVL